MPATGMLSLQEHGASNWDVCLSLQGHGASNGNICHYRDMVPATGMSVTAAIDEQRHGASSCLCYNFPQRTQL